MHRKIQLAPYQRLYLDLDGVKAGYDEHYIHLFGHRPGDVTPKMMWENVFSADRFFYNLPLLPGAGEFFREVAHTNPIFITKCPVENFDQCAQDKRDWVVKYLTSECLVIPITLEDIKARYMNREGDLLIDDFASNCDPWDAAGGHAIKHDGKFYNTAHYLRMAIDKNYGRT